MQPRGGTEILLANFQKHISPELLSRVNIIVSATTPGQLRPGVPNILWHHLDTDQAMSRGLENPDFVERLDALVFVSAWQMEKHIAEFNLPRQKCTVIKNAIQPVEWIDKPRNGKLKLIYTSTPWRGLEILLESFRLLGRTDIELDIYSSTVIYGVNFMKGAYQPLFDRCRATPGVNYRGYAANKAVVKACQAAHIFAYPSVFAETSCLAAIEAGAAGCRLVTTDWGALSETCGVWGNYIPLNPATLIRDYAEFLDNQINCYWNNYGLYQEQSKYFNNLYSWSNRKIEWVKLIEQFTN